MYQNAHETYLEGRIASADPVELVNLLYQGAASAVRDARQYLAEGDIPARSRSISRACDILTELTVSLDHSAGGDLSRRLEQLYDYMQRRLLEANFRQEDGPLAEVLGLLATLGEAWAQIRVESAAPQPPTGFWSPGMAETPMESEHAWSF
jgi:flagellar protein FliS